MNRWKYTNPDSLNRAGEFAPGLQPCLAWARPRLFAGIRAARAMGGDVRNSWKHVRSGLRPASIRNVDHAIGLDRCIRLGTALACAALVLGASCALAHRALGAQQEPTDSEVKAAYLFNFLKFVDWPDDPARDSQAPWVLGVVGDTSVGEDLKQLASGKSVRGRELEVKKVSAPAELRACKSCSSLHRKRSGLRACWRTFTAPVF